MLDESYDNPLKGDTVSLMKIAARALQRARSDLSVARAAVEAAALLEWPCDKTIDDFVADGAWRYDGVTRLSRLREGISLLLRESEKLEESKEFFLSAKENLVEDLPF